MVGSLLSTIEPFVLLGLFIVAISLITRLILPWR